MKKTHDPTNAPPKIVKSTDRPKTTEKKEENSERDALVSAAVAEIGKLLAKEDTNTALVRFDIGEHVNRIKNAEDSYGSGLVAEVAKKLGRDDDTLYDYGRVAALFTRSGFQKLSARKNAAGTTLSFSHFVELAKKDGKNGTGLDQERWKPLFEKALKEALSVRALRDLVRDALGGGEDAGSQSLGLQSPGPIALLAKLSRTFCDKTSTLAAAVGDVEKAGLADGHNEQLDLAIANVKETQTTCEALLVRLRAVREHALPEAAQ